MTPSRRTAKPNTPASRIRSALPYILSGLLGALLLYLAFAGYGFAAGRASFNAMFENHDRAIQAGRVPFSADQLVWIPMGLAFLAPLSLPLLRRSRPLTGIRVVSGVVIASALVCFVIEIVWVATGKPYHAYSIDADSQADYVWPILGSLGWAVVFSLPFILIAVRGRRRSAGRR